MTVAYLNFDVKQAEKQILISNGFELVAHNSFLTNAKNSCS